MKVDNITSSSLQSRKFGKPQDTTVENIVKASDKIGLEYRETKGLTKDEMENIVHLFNDFMKPIRTNLKFELHDRLERYYVSVIDSETDEIIKEIPPKKLLDMYAEMAIFMGILVDEKA